MKHSDRNSLRCCAPRCRAVVDLGSAIQLTRPDGEIARLCWPCWERECKEREELLTPDTGDRICVEEEAKT